MARKRWKRLDLRATSTVRETPAPYLPLMVPLLLAHTGHWAIWGLYVIPVVIVLAATLNSFRAQRREGRQQRQH